MLIEDHKAPGIVGGASSLAVNPPRPLACELRIIDVYSFLLNGFRSVNSVATVLFSSFLHSTCSLSVSHMYLALGEVYLPLRAAIPNYPTLRDITR